MELAALNDLTVEEGSTFIYPFFLEDPNGPIDLSGATARMQVRKPLSSPDTILNLTEGNGIEIVPLEGKITITLTDEQTTVLDFSRARYDIEVEFADGTVKRIMEGRIVLSREVTR